MLGALRGRLVGWAGHKAARRVTAHPPLCDQGHLRNAGSEHRCGLLLCPAEEGQENAIWRESAGPSSLANEKRNHA